MALPKKLKHFNMFNDGNSYLGVAKGITLPKLARKMEAWRGGGMDGGVKVDLGASDDGMQLEWSLGGLDLIVMRQFGAVKVDGVQLRYAGSYQRDDDGSTTAVEIVMRGRHEEIDMGDVEAGEDTEHKITTALTYYKLTVDGREEIEIDTLNFIYKVDGVDLLEAHRKNIGI